MARVGREREGEGDDVTERHSRGRLKGKSQKGKEGGGARPQKSGRQNGRPGKKESVGFQTCPIFFRKEDRRRRKEI